MSYALILDKRKENMKCLQRKQSRAMKSENKFKLIETMVRIIIHRIQ